MKRERFRTALFYGVLAVALSLCLLLALPFLGVLGWAALLGVVIAPVHRRLARRMRQPSLAAMLSCLLVVVIVVIPLTFLSVQVFGEATRLARQMQAASSQGLSAQGLSLKEMPAIHAAQRWLERAAGIAPSSLEALVRQSAGQLGSALVKQSMAMVKSIIWGIVQVALMVITLFFLLRDAERLLPAVRIFIPLDSKETDALLRRIMEMIQATVYGQTIVALAQGTLGGLAFWALGVPSPLLWGVVMTALCLIPLLGAPTVWAPAALWLAAQGEYGRALALALWGMFVVGTIDNILRPLLIGARTQQHPLLVFFSVFGAVLLLGPLGLFLGPVILIITLALVDILKLKLAEPGAQPLSGITPERQDIASPAVLADGGKHPVAQKGTSR